MFRHKVADVWMFLAPNSPLNGPFQVLLSLPRPLHVLGTHGFLGPFLGEPLLSIRHPRTVVKRVAEFLLREFMVSVRIISTADYPVGPYCAEPHF